MRVSGQGFRRCPAYATPLGSVSALDAESAPGGQRVKRPCRGAMPPRHRATVPRQEQSAQTRRALASRFPHAPSGARCGKAEIPYDAPGKPVAAGRFGIADWKPAHDWHFADAGRHRPGSEKSRRHPAWGQLWTDPGGEIGPPSHFTTSAVISTACNSTSAPAAAQSRLIASSSLWLSPPAQGHMIIAVGAT